MSENHQGTTWQVLKRLAVYIKGRKLGLIMGVIGMIGFAAVDATFVYSIKPLIDEGLTGNNPQVLKWMPIFVMVIVTARGICNFMASYGTAWVGHNVVMDLQQALFVKLLRMPVHYFDEQSTGGLLSKITYDTNQVRATASSTLINLVREGATAFALMVMMFFQSWQLSLIFFVVGPIVGVIISLVSKRFRKISTRIQHAMGSVTTAAEQMINGYREVVMFGGQTKEEQRFRQVSNHVRQQNMKLVAAQAISTPVVQIIAATALALVLYLASFRSVMDTLTPGTFTVVITSLFMLMRPLKQLTQVNTEFQRGVAACTSLFAVLDMESEQDQGTYRVERARGELEFRDVSFRYAGADKPALDSLNLRVAANTTVALVGRSGSGKSTLTNLVTRFYNPGSGQITLDGHDLQHYELACLRSQIALVSQHVHLFNDTIANNIAYAMEPRVSLEQIREAARTANALEFIDKLPQGLDTMVGENGVLLSGGQRQRIAIARALLRNAPILILDEATSALDTESERLIQQALEALQRNRTSLVIAHRLSTVENADQIVVLDDGRIIEQGTHGALLQADGMYAQLHKLQRGSQ